MSTLVLRQNLSQPLSIAQADQNLINLNNDKTESNTAVSVDGEMVLFSGTNGKLFKRATTTGLAKLSAGVVSAAKAADIVATIGATAVQNATTAANGGVTSVTVNGTTYTGAVTVSTTWASITGKPTGPNIEGTWTWSDPGGQPTYLWGSSNGAQMNPYYIGGLSVNYANSAGSAGSASTLGGYSATNLPYAPRDARANVLGGIVGMTQDTASAPLIGSTYTGSGTNITYGGTTYAVGITVSGAWRCIAIFAGPNNVNNSRALFQRIS